MSRKVSFLEGLGLLPVGSFEFIHTPHSVGLLWTSDWPIVETSNTQHTQEVDFHARGGIRTRSPRKRVAAVPRLIPRGRQVRRGPIQRPKSIYERYNVETLRFWWFEFLTWGSLLRQGYTERWSDRGTGSELHCYIATRHAARSTSGLPSLGFTRVCLP
jgi:hypothetical protein